jgi:hypothetical protein
MTSSAVSTRTSTVRVSKHPMNDRHQSRKRALDFLTSVWRPNATYRAALVALVFAHGFAISQVTSARNIVTRYVTAVQQRDYKAIVDLNYSVKSGESVIRVDNPKILWSKLIAEYRAQKIRELSGENKKLDAAGEYDVKEITTLFTFFPKDCRWAVVEVRPWSDLAGHQFTRVFLGITYAIRETSPASSSGRPLQRAVLEFTVMAPYNATSTVFSYQRVEAGDVLWSGAP